MNINNKRDKFFDALVPIPGYLLANGIERAIAPIGWLGLFRRIIDFVWIPVMIRVLENWTIHIIIILAFIMSVTLAMWTFWEIVNIVINRKMNKPSPPTERGILPSPEAISQLLKKSEKSMISDHEPMFPIATRNEMIEADVQHKDNQQKMETPPHFEVKIWIVWGFTPSVDEVLTWLAMKTVKEAFMKNEALMKNWGKLALPLTNSVAILTMLGVINQFKLRPQLKRDKKSAPPHGVLGIEHKHLLVTEIIMKELFNKFKSKTQLMSFFDTANNHLLTNSWPFFFGFSLPTFKQATPNHLKMINDYCKSWLLFIIMVA